MRKFIARAVRGFFGRMGIDLVRSSRMGVCPLRDAHLILKAVKSKLCLFDVGANVGQTSLQMTKLWPEAQIHSFEPFPEAFEVLQKLMSQFPQATTYQCALAEKTRSQKLYINAASVTNSLLPNSSEASQFQPQNSINSKENTVFVPTDTVDDICSRSGLHRLHLLKTDTQGFDLRVLEGAETMIRERRVSMVLSEVLFVPLYEGQCWFLQVIDRMKSEGFQLVGLYNGVNDPHTGMLQWADALFVHPEALRTAQNG